MSSGELLIIVLVALIVFGPNRLPMLASHLAKLWRQIQFFKEEAAAFWQKQLNEQQLRENNHKAEQADSRYQQEDKH